LIERRDKLLGGIGRSPDEITAEETAKNMADFVSGQVDPFLKNAKAMHVSEKAPFLTAGRTCDAFLHALIDDMEAGKKRLNAVRKKWADAKAAEERRRREDVARQEREEAERLAHEAAEKAAAMVSQDDLDAAAAAEEAAAQARRDAEKAEQAAAAKPAELGRTRGDYGGMTTLKQFWNFRDLDRAAIDLEALRQHLPTDALEKAVRSYINANKDALLAGERLAGVEIFEDTRL
jgi:phage host-nuclease inhibitor protein Gam